MFFCCCCCKKLFFTHPAIQLTKMKEITSHPKQAHPSQTPRNPASKRSMVKSPQPLFDRKPPKVEVENKEICLHRSLRTVTLAKVNYAVDKNLFFGACLMTVPGAMRISKLNRMNSAPSFRPLCVPNSQLWLINQPPPFRSNPPRNKALFNPLLTIGLP